MRKRVLLLACTAGAVGVVGLSPHAQASCTQLRPGGRCIENVVCEIANEVRPTPCPR